MFVDCDYVCVRSLKSMVTTFEEDSDTLKYANHVIDGYFLPKQPCASARSPCTEPMKDHMEGPNHEGTRIRYASRRLQRWPAEPLHPGEPAVRYSDIFQFPNSRLHQPRQLLFGNQPLWAFFGTLLGDRRFDGVARHLPCT